MDSLSNAVPIDSKKGQEIIKKICKEKNPKNFIKPVGLTKKEIEEEIDAINAVTNAHEAQLELNTQGIKVNAFLKKLLEAELEKFK